LHLEQDDDNSVSIPAAWYAMDKEGLHFVDF